jgi:hypothetical protein
MGSFQKGNYTTNAAAKNTENNNYSIMNNESLNKSFNNNTQIDHIKERASSSLYTNNQKH